MRQPPKEVGNLTLLTIAAASTPPDVEVVPFDGLLELPHFNPDIEVSGTPESVMRWRRALSKSDAGLIATPEYSCGL
jgi:chromate reductase, NAD(P)H dehydrogenase (quinone)